MYLLLILAILVVIAIGIYNGLVSAKNQCDQAWSDIDTQLKKRYDLIPNLVETVKGYAAHEAGTLEKVVQLRNSAMNAKTPTEKLQAENALTAGLKSIFALAENYPDLKANQNFLQLQGTLSDTENHIQASREQYNSAVNTFNTKIEVFPNNLISKQLGFTKKDFFKAPEEEKQNVKVDFK